MKSYEDEYRAELIYSWTLIEGKSLVEYLEHTGNALIIVNLDSISKDISIIGLYRVPFFDLVLCEFYPAHAIVDSEYLEPAPERMAGVFLSLDLRYPQFADIVEEDRPENHIITLWIFTSKSSLKVFINVDGVEHSAYVEFYFGDKLVEIREHRLYNFVDSL